MRHLKTLTALIAIILFACGCDPVKRVINNDKRTQRVVDHYLKNYPLPAPKIEYRDKVIPGEPQLTIQTAYEYIPGPPGKTDTVTRIVTKTITRTDTVERIITVTDPRPIEAAKKSVLEKDAKIAQLEADKKELTRKNTRLSFQFWGLVAVIAIAVGLLLFAKAKKTII